MDRLADSERTGLQLTEVDAGYGDLQVLHRVSLTLPSRRIGVLLGPNGAGKSTVLRTICRLVPWSRGTVRVGGRDLAREPTHALAKLGLVYVPQGRVNFGTLSVQENLLLGLPSVTTPEERTLRLARVCVHFPVLRERLQELAFRLSGGQQQMLALGRALMAEPQLLLLDEPSLGLAPKVVKEVFATIRRLNEEFGVTILVVEHNIRSVLGIADVGFVMIGGRIVASDTADRLRTSDVLRRVFVGEVD